MQTLILSTTFLLLAPQLFAATPSDYLQKPADWFASPEAREITQNILTWQAPEGDWPKNRDTTSAPRLDGAPAPDGTFDNGATVGELRFLAKHHTATADPKSKAAFLKGLHLILQAQYPNGGWPQSFPPGRGYHRHITFNDDVFARLAEFVRDAAGHPDFTFLDHATRARAKAAFDLALNCIVRTQIIVNGEPTAWCAQHDEVTLEPRPARSFELVSLSGAESARLLRLLMTIENPSPEIRRAIEAGVEWFEAAKLTGIRQVRVDGDKKIIQDNSASPLWARFYEIGTNRPIFAGRDGVKHYSLSEIEPERRTGYAWYGTWGAAVEKAHQKWSAENPPARTASPGPNTKARNPGSAL